MALYRKKAFPKIAQALGFALGTALVMPALLAHSRTTDRPAALPRIESQRVELLSHVGGLITAGIPLSEGTVLANEGSALIHLDFSTAAPRVLAQQDLNHGIILDLARSGDIFYALTEDGLLSLVRRGSDLPQVVSYTPGSGQTLAVVEGRVAIAARRAGLRCALFDTNGIPISATTLPLAGDARDVALAADGQHAYVAAGDAGVHIVDLSDPGAPRLEGSLVGVGPAEAVGLVGSLLAVGTGEQIVILDPAPGADGVVGTYAPLREGRRALADDEYLYVADAVDGLKILWRAAPDRPVQIYGEAGRPARDLWLEGDHLFLVGADGFRVLDISSRFRPLEVARLSLPGTPQGIAVANGYAYIALGEEGVATANIENLASPRLVQRIPLDSPARDVLVDGNTLYVAADEGGLAIIDLEEGMLRDVQPLPGPALDLAQRSRALYIAGGEAGLIAVDITRPGEPVLAGVLPAEPGQRVNSVAISGKRAYLADGGGVIVVDVSFPHRMGRLTRVPVAARHAAVLGTDLFVLGGNRITLYDIRATAEPVRRRTYIGMGQVSRLAADGERVFVTGGGVGPPLVVLGLSAADFPIELDSIGQAGEAYRAWPAGDGVWLARGYAGLQRYRLSEGGALALSGDYRIVEDASVLALGGSHLLVGGRLGWVLLRSAGGEPPQPLGWVSDAAAVRALALHEDLIAVATSDQGVALYTTEGESGPTLVAQRSSRGAATDIALDGQYVYAADAGGLTIYDSRYLQAVTSVSTPAPANGVVVRGQRAYLPLADGQLAVVDLADPTGGLRSRSTVAIGRPADLLAGPDSQSVYALADDRLLRIRVDNPDRLWVAGRGDLRAAAARGQYANGLLWALSPDGVLRLYDPRRLGWEAPAYQGRIDAAGVALAVGEGVAYIAYGQDGMGLVDAVTRTAGPIFYEGEVNALYQDQDVLFAAGSTLTAWDISRPADPRLLDDLPLTGSGREIRPAVDGRLLLSLENGLAIVAWDGEKLSQVGQLTTTGAVDHAAQVGRRAFLGLHQGSLLVVDVSDPSQPVRLFSYTSPAGQFVNDLLPLDETTLLVSWEGGLEALDVGSTASTPRLENIIPTGREQALHLAISPDGSQAALSTGEGEILLLDVSDAAVPQVKGFVDTPGNGQRVALDSSTLYVADGICGLRIVDIQDVSSPRERGYWRSNYANDVAVGPDGLIYLAEANQLLVLRYDPAAPPEPPPIPQFPQPASGQEGLPLTTSLEWRPSPEACNPLSYNVYLGVTADPPFIGQVNGEPMLEVADLDSLRTYYWRVEAIDRQGDIVQGPVWRFTTAPADFPDGLPPAPPLFVERARRNPLLAAGLLGAALLLAALGGLYWRRRRARPSDRSDWYFNGDH